MRQAGSSMLLDNSSTMAGAELHTVKLGSVPAPVNSWKVPGNRQELGRLTGSGCSRSQCIQDRRSVDSHCVMCAFFQAGDTHRGGALPYDSYESRSGPQYSPNMRASPCLWSCACDNA